MAWMLETERKKGKPKRKSPSLVKKILIGLAALGAAVVLISVILAVASNLNPPSSVALLTANAPSGNLMDANATRLAAAGSAAVPTNVVIISATSGQPLPTIIAQGAPLAPADQQLLDASNTKTNALDTAQFAFNARLGLKIAKEEGLYDVRGTGKIGGLNDPNNFKLTLDVNGNLTTNGKLSQFSASIRILNGSIYFQVTSPTTQTAIKWLRLDFKDVLNAAVLTSPNGAAANAIPGVPNLDISKLGDLRSILNLFNYSKFVATTRQPNSNVFVSDVNVLAYLQSEDFANALNVVSQMESQVTPQPGAQLSSDMLRQLVAALLPNATLRFEQTVDEQEQVNTDFRLDGSATLNTASADGSTLQPLDITLRIEVHLSNHGVPFTVDVPPDAEIVHDLSQLPSDVVVPLK